jgi:hypothetical protein
MNSLRHVFWRGAMALSLMAVGVGSGFGFRDAPLQAGAATDDCAVPALRALRPAAIDAATFAADIDHARGVAQQRRSSRTIRRG